MHLSFGRSGRDIIRYGLIILIALPALLLSEQSGKEYYCVFAAAALFAALSIRLKSSLNLLWDILFCLMSSAVGIYLTHAITTFGHEMMETEGFRSVMAFTLKKHGFDGIVPELLICIGLFFFLRAMRIPSRIACFVTPIPMVILSLADYFVYTFRGSELSPMDFYSWRTALSVVGGYSFPFLHPYCIIYAPFLLFAIGILRIEMTGNPSASSAKNKPLILRIFRWQSILCLSVSILSFVGLVKTVEDIDSREYGLYWGDEGSMYHGYITNFCLLIKMSSLSAPEGYSPDYYRELFISPDNNEEPGVGSSQDAELCSEYDNVNIIVIMNESFADLRCYRNVVGDYENVIPYFDSLAEGGEVLSGYAYASVFGGNTANSEFEFLTALTTAGLPYGSIPYSLYIKNPTYSLPSYLSSLGYSTTAMHPFEASNWNRENVYPKLSFDDMLFLDDFEYEESDMVRSPSNLAAWAGCMSDECAYRNILRLIDEDESDTPHFYFLITMQNHGGYSPENEKLPITEYLTLDSEEHSGYVNSYLTNIRRSDEALNYLHRELENRDEKYLVLMFGDHQPRIEGTNDEGAGGPGGCIWLVPYVLWANYDLPDYMAGTRVNTSINYLAIDVLNAAGLPLSPYFDTINEIRTNIPIINSTGYFSAETGSWLPIVDGFTAGSEDERLILNRYTELQYYSLFDSN